MSNKLNASSFASFTAVLVLLFLIAGLLYGAYQFRLQAKPEPQPENSVPVPAPVASPFQGPATPTGFQSAPSHTGPTGPPGPGVYTTGPTPASPTLLR